MTIGFHGRTAAAAGALAAALVLAGCAGDEGGPGRGDRGPGAREAPAPLTPAEVKAVLPQAFTVPGWKVTDSMVLDMSGKSAGRACAGGKPGECAPARGVGTVVLAKEGEGRMTFSVFAHHSAGAASDAYPFLWKEASGAWFGQPERASVGAAGDRRDALRGEYETGYGSTIQIRVGPTLLSVKAETPGTRPRRTDAELTALAAMFAGRARQAHSGELPSAVVRGDVLK
ncbi:hypothetical protein [Streptomyces sp. CAU 1734]|uniref:hypothetical protein n=1 Tax=Streptomyces sp. CAU 1734 TaxID=3140360 RepID=UPI0032611E7E